MLCEQERGAVRPPVVRRDLALEVELEPERTRRSRDSRSPGRVSPSRSCSHASRWSPTTGDQQRAASDIPSSSCSPTVSPVRGSTTRSAGWMRSPCSACSRQRRVPSAESAPRRKPPTSTLPSRTERSERWIACGGAAVERDVDGEARRGRDAPRRRSPAPARALRSTRAARRRGTASRLAAVERLHEPAARTRRRSRPGTRGLPRRRVSGRRRRARPGGRSPVGASPVSVSSACTCQTPDSFET